jgi:TfoX/Sxy family transcriptional regulator of competence genes
MAAHMTPDERFDELVTVFALEPHVTPPDGSRGFGSHAVRVRGKIFAMVVRGHLVVKLPKDRVDELVESGDGVRFDANKGKPMKEWLTLDADSTLEWESLAREALVFVAPA